MSFFSFSREAASFDVTPIENDFLMELMPDAPEAALRVYLYARMLCLHPEIGELKDMAKALRMDEDEALDAFRYWEQQGLVEQLSDRPARFEMRSMRERKAAPAPGDLDTYRYAALHAALNQLFEKGKLERRHYVKAAGWVEEGFTEDAIAEIVKYEQRMPGGQTPDSLFKRVDERVKEWAERGIRTPKEVQRAIAFEDQVYAMASEVLRQLAIRRGVTKNELDCARRWIEEWHLTIDDVIDACAETTKSRDPSIAYLDAILKKQVEKGPDVYFGAVKSALRELNASNPTPTPEQLKAYAAFLEKGFEPETVRLAAVQCARRNRNRFEDLEWMLNSWDEEKVHTRAEAERYIRDLQQKSEEIGALLKTAGLSRRPNRVDLEYYEGWVPKYSAELLRCAAELSQRAKEPVKYMDKLLSNWAQAGITTAEAARAAGAPAAAAKESASGRQNYLQHDYSEDDFGKDFFYDVTRKHPKEGDDQ